LIRKIHLQILLAVFITSFGFEAAAQNNPDTLKAKLDEITVVGFSGNRSIMETPGSISYLDNKLINGFSDQSLVYGLNTVAGVKMDERAPGSYRIAIRGSAIRSPFGVRNVKVYWNDFPLTLPSGSTPLNLLNNQNIKQVEVIKGPAGSIYGAGTGGVLLINSFPKNPQTERIVDASVGDYGLFKYGGEYNTKKEGMISQYKYASQVSDGYRDQSFFERRTFETGVKVFTPSNALVSVSTLYSNLNYGIPGGLNLQQFQDDPTQARAGSVEQNASIDQEDFIIGANIESEWSEHWSGGTNIFANISKFENPFNFDYKSESRKSWGSRPWVQYKDTFGDTDLKLKLGAENHFGNNNARNYDNENGIRDSLRFEDEIEIKNRSVYLTGELDLPGKVFINAGISVNRVNYDVTRVATKEGGVDPNLISKNFETAILPRIAIAKRLTDFTTLHASVSAGFSPPTLEEFRTNDGELNENLEPEKGINYEIGTRGNTGNGSFRYDLAIFYFKLKESIVLTESQRDGTLAFANAGSTNQTGFEFSTNWIAINNENGFLNLLEIQSSYTFHNFKYDNYVKEGDDFSDNRLPGVAPHTLFTSLSAETNIGLYGQLSYNYTDEIPLTDGNTVYSDPYHLMKGKFGFKQILGEKFDLDIYAGVDNLLDQQYSLGYDINPFIPNGVDERNGRFYQPAPGINWFGGIKVNYLIK
jgi:iron complex outermembrane receptor protein